MLRAFLIFVAIAAVLFAGFVFAIDHPSTRGPLRCWIAETFYELSYEAAPVAGAPVIQAVRATDPVVDMCDAADDPAIWPNPLNPEKSLVLGTNKQSSVNVYDLSGKLVYRADEIGEPNNVDLRVVDGDVIAVASDKEGSEIEAFQVNPASGVLSVLPGAPFPALFEDEVYGICLYSTASELYTFVTDKSGLVAQYAITESEGQWQSEHVRSLRVDTQPEGCVVDDAAHRLYVGEEDVGIWSFDARADSDVAGSLIAQTAPEGPLVADVEGLAIYSSEPAQEGYLVASSQGNNTYAIFDRMPPHEFRGRFQVEYDGVLIGDTDGLDVVSAPIGEDFPKGMLVIQDGLFRDSEGKRRKQRFAYVSWSGIEGALELGD